MIEVHIHRDYGPDETFEVETEKEAHEVASQAASDPDTRRVLIIDGVVIAEYNPKG